MKVSEWGSKTCRKTFLGLYQSENLKYLAKNLWFAKGDVQICKDICPDQHFCIR